MEPTKLSTFKQWFDVIAVDLPGFGQSVGVKAHNSIETIAKHVLSFLSSINVHEFILMGHSMGGMIVQKMAGARTRPHFQNSYVTEPGQLE